MSPTHKREASRETLEAIAEEVERMHPGNRPSIVLDNLLAAYRAETASPLRTRAEVDAEIAATIRNDRLASRGLGMANSTLHAMDRLCAEPTAPEGE